MRVEDAQLSRSNGFVAVYSSDGQQLLGSAEVDRVSSNVDDDRDRPVTVTLEDRLTGTTRLLVVLHADDGNGRFDGDEDPRVTATMTTTSSRWTVSATACADRVSGERERVAHVMLTGPRQQHRRHLRPLPAPQAGGGADRDGPGDGLPPPRLICSGSRPARNPFRSAQ